MATRLKYLVRASARIILDGRVVTSVDNHVAFPGADVNIVIDGVKFEAERIVRHSDYVIQDVLEIPDLAGNPHTFEFQVFAPLRLPAAGD